MKQFSIKILTEIFNMIVGMYERVRGLRPDDTPEQERNTFFVIMFVFISVVVVLLYFSILVFGD